MKIKYWFLRGLFFLFFIFAVASMQSIAYAQKLSWLPPIQSNPTHIYITIDANKSIINFQKNSDPIESRPVNKQLIVTFAENEDAIIHLPTTGPLVMPGILVRFGHNIRVIGGHMIATATGDPNGIRGLLRFTGTTGSSFVEGVILDCNERLGLDGLLVGGVAGQTFFPDVYLQNSIIKGVYSLSTSALHSDGFQYYGATGVTRMDKVSVRSKYQGLFLDPQHDIHSIDLRRVDVDYIDPPNGEGYIFYLRQLETGRRPLVFMDEVYVGRRDTQFGGEWEKYSVYPPSMLTFGGIRIGDSITFPSFTEVVGEVKLAPPPNGPFVNESDVGVGYVSPGYVGLP